MLVKLLTEHHLEFLSLKGGYTGSSESTLVKMPHCWKSHATAHYYYKYLKSQLKNLDTAAFSRLTEGHPLIMVSFQML